MAFTGVEPGSSRLSIELPTTELSGIQMNPNICVYILQYLSFFAYIFIILYS